MCHPSSYYCYKHYSYNVNKTKQNGGQDESKINHNTELNTEGQQQQHEPH
jgi:hypothetical protein